MAEGILKQNDKQCERAWFECVPKERRLRLERSLLRRGKPAVLC